jgi:hypothetical protein
MLEDSAAAPVARSNAWHVDVGTPGVTGGEPSATTPGTVPCTDGGRPRRPRKHASRIDLVLAFAGYGLLALVAHWPVYPLDPSRLPDCGCGDVAQSAWFLSWAPFAVSHGLNPLSTDWLNYPVGANLAISAQELLYGILLFPVTWLLDAFASYNLLMWLAFAASATSMYWVVRRFRAGPFAAAVAGLFYGFSPYMVATGLAHLNLAFVPVPPLIFYALYEIVVVQTARYRWGVLLGVLIVFQYMMSSEVLATTALMSFVGLAVLGLSRPRAVVGSAGRAAGPLTAGVLLALVALWYPIWYSLRGPQHLIAPIHAWRNQFHADVLGAVVPTVAEKLYPAAWSAIGTSFLQGAWYENGSYIGIPLLLLAGAIAARRWSSGWARFTVLMAVVAWILSLGPYLTFDGHDTSVPLPFDLLRSVPLLDNILPSRIALYSDLALAALLAMGAHAVSARVVAWRENRGSLSRLPVRHRLLYGTIAVLAVVAPLSLLPAWPYSDAPGPAPNATAAFFRSAQVAMIPRGAVTLTYPYPEMTDNEAMNWQVLANMRFRLVGGYDLFTVPPGFGSGMPAALAPAQVESALSYLADGTTYPLTSRPPPAALSPALVREFIRSNRVQVVVVDLEAPRARVVATAFSNAIGPSTRRIDGLAIWVLSRPRREPALDAAR